MVRKYWYAFTGASGQENQINKYFLVPDSSNCTIGDVICKIYAFYGGDIHPFSLSSHILSYILLVKTDEVPQPRIGNPIVLCKS